MLLLLILIVTILICCCVISPAAATVVGGGQDPLTIRLMHDSPKEQHTRDALQQVMKKHKPSVYVPTVIIDENGRAEAASDYKYMVMPALHDPSQILRVFVHIQNHYPVWISTKTKNWDAYVKWFDENCNWKPYSDDLQMIAFELPVYYNTAHVLHDSSIVNSTTDKYSQALKENMPKLRTGLKRFKLDYDSLQHEYKRLSPVLRLVRSP